MIYDKPKFKETTLLDKMFMMYLHHDIKIWLQCHGVSFWLLYPIETFKRVLHRRKFHVGDIIEKCDYHPAYISKIYHEEGGQASIDAISLLTHQEGSCSLFHCGVRHLTDEEIKRKKEAWELDGDKGLAIDAGWLPDDYDKYEKIWTHK